MHIINAFYIWDVPIDASLVSASKVCVNDFSDERTAILIDFSCCVKAFCFLWLCGVPKPKCDDDSENADSAVNPGLYGAASLLNLEHDLILAFHCVPLVEG